MKIIKKPKILPCTCKACGTVFKPKARHLLPHVHFPDLVCVRCPVCKNQNIVHFEKGGE